MPSAGLSEDNDTFRLRPSCIPDETPETPQKEVTRTAERVPSVASRSEAKDAIAADSMRRVQPATKKSARQGSQYSSKKYNSPNKENDPYLTAQLDLDPKSPTAPSAFLDQSKDGHMLSFQSPEPANYQSVPGGNSRIAEGAKIYCSEMKPASAFTRHSGKDAFETAHGDLFAEEPPLHMATGGSNLLLDDDKVFSPSKSSMMSERYRRQTMTG